MQFLLDTDREWFLFLNGLHATWLDPVAFWFSNEWVWTPLYLGLLYLTIRDNKKQSWIILCGVAVTILFADQVTTSVMKPFFERLRPSRDPTLEGLVHLVYEYRGGKFGFASSHAANTFGTALFLWLTLHNKHQWVWLLFIWAAIVTYTRIYLGVHYPGDVIAGAAVGLVGALAGFGITQWFRRKYYSDVSIGSAD